VSARSPISGINAEWSDFANIISGIMRTERKEAIKECIRILQSHRLDVAEAERLMEEAEGRK